MDTTGRQGLVVVALAAALGLAAGGGEADPQRPPASQAPGAPADAHGAHGTPGGWKFTWPKGDPAKGREVFAKLECWSCHEVRGETFPAPKDGDQVGPELSQMGPLHEPEFFAEALINPSAVIDQAKGYAGPDGSSKMPSFNDSITVQEAIDLVAYLRALKPPAGAGQGHGKH